VGAILQPCEWSFLCAGMMRTELEVEVELWGVFWLSCDISRSVKRVPRSIYLVVGRYVKKVIPNGSFLFLCCKFLVIPQFHLCFCIHVRYLKYVTHMPKLGCLFYYTLCVPDVEFLETASLANIWTITILHFSLYIPLEFILFSGALLQWWLHKVLVFERLCSS